MDIKKFHCIYLFQYYYLLFLSCLIAAVDSVQSWIIGVTVGKMVDLCPFKKKDTYSTVSSSTKQTLIDQRSTVAGMNRASSGFERMLVEKKDKPTAFHPQQIQSNEPKRF